MALKVKLIIFDLSGVCFTNEESVFLELFIKGQGLDRESFLARYGDLIRQAEVHRISGREVWRKLVRDFGVSADIDKIIREMIDMKAPNWDVLQLAKILKSQYLTVYYTNYNEDYWRLIKSRFDFAEWFSWGVVSYEIGIRKPSRRGFEHIMARAGVRPEETVFVDDSPQNLLEPAASGTHTIRFTGKNILQERLKQLGVTMK